MKSILVIGGIAEAMANSDVILSSSSDSTSTDSLTSGSSAGANSAGSSDAASAGSSGAGGSSAGGAGSGSSGSVVSSSAVASSSSLATKIAGTCSAPVNPFSGLQKNAETTWSFTNSTTNLTPETYDWTFDEGASIALSTDAAPKVSYSVGGTHKATLIVNKGKDSESAPITCTAINVVGTRVSGCSTSDGSELTYTWEEGVTANGTSATKSISTGGTHTPKVTVTAESDTVVTCQAVTATANCYLAGGENDHWNQHGEHPHSTAPGGSFYFAPVDVEGSTEAGISMDVTVGDGTPKTINVKWGGASPATQLTAPSQEGEYPVTLSHNGRDVCSATLTVAYPKITSTSCTINGSNKFSPGSSFNGWVGADNLSMDFYRDDTKLTSLTVNRYYNSDLYTVTMPTEVGSYDFRLVYHDNEVCKVTKTVNLIKPSCNIGAVGSASGTNYNAIPGQQFAFKPGNSNYPGGTKMVTLEFNGSTQQIEAKPSNNTETVLDAPDALGSYTVKLSDDDGQVCTATLTVDYPKPSCNIGKVGNASEATFTTIPGQSFDFKPGNSDFVGTINMDLTFNGNTQSITVKPTNKDTTLTAPDAAGTYPITLEYKGDPVCTATLTVKKITSSGCKITKDNNSGNNFFTSGEQSFSGWSPNDDGPNLMMDLYLNDNKLGTKNVNYYYNDPNWYQITTLPSASNVYTLKFHGNTVCTIDE